MDALVQKCQFYYTLSNQSVPLVTVRSNVSLLTEQLWWHSDILRRPLKFEKISHFVSTLLLTYVISKKVGDFFQFCDLVTISELYEILTLSGLVSMAVCFFKIRLAKFESQGPILSIFNLFSLRFMKLWVRFLRKKLLALCITPRTFFITTKKKCWNCQKVWNAIPSAGSCMY